MVRLIGIDPGLIRTGIVLGKKRKGNLVVIKHSLFGGEGSNWFNRCCDITEKINKWILINTEEHCHLRIFVEEPFSTNRFKMSGTPVINRLFSNIILGLSQLSSEFRPSQINMINPRTVKSIFTGNGNANKAKMIVHARRLYKFKPMSKLDTETLADAIGILYCCYMFSRVEGDEKVKGIMRLR